MSNPTKASVGTGKKRARHDAAEPAEEVTRRRFLGGTGVAAVGAALGGTGLGIPELLRAEAAGLDLPAELSEGARAAAVLDTLPGKKPLIKLSYRPPNYETPIEYFRTAITPNDAFFVRYHLSNIPEVDAKTWKVAIGGDGANGQAEVTLDDLKRMPAVEVVAVNLCSGNRRGLFQPHVTGVEWGYGAMGCARWKGVRLKDLLDKVGVKKEAIEIVFNGADGPIVDKTPDFIKSIPVWKAMDENTLVAYEMNGQPLPHFNGFPARIVVPGWTGTYWMKHVTSINGGDQARKRVLDEPGLSHPAGQVPAGRAVHLARHGGQYADHRDGGELADHQPCAGREREGGLVRHGRRHCLGWRIRPSDRRNVDRRRQDLACRRRSGRTWAASPSAPSASRSRRRPRASKP